MSAPPERVAPHEIAFFFNTNEQVPAAPLLFFISEIERIARTKRHFGDQVFLELIQVETGTKLVKLSVNQKIALAAVAVAGWQAAIQTSEFALDIADRLKKENRLAQCAADMAFRHGVIATTIVGHEVHVTIPRDEMPLYRRYIDDSAPADREERLGVKSFQLGTPDGRTLSDGTGQTLGGDLGDEFWVPRMGAPVTGPTQRVRWVGTFEQEEAGYVFVRDDGKRYPVAGVDYKSDIPTGAKLFVTGVVARDLRDELEFFPAKVAVVDT